MATLKTQGTEFYILDSADTGNEVRKIGQITGFSGVGSGSATEIETTNFDSTAKEFVVGLRDNGSISINLDWDPQDASHDVLNDLVGGANKRFFIACSEAATDPTFAASTYTLPTARTTIDFQAGVVSFQLDAGTDDVWRGTVELRISGALTITAAA